MNFCSECGHKIESGSKFCSGCGSRLRNSLVDENKKTHMAQPSGSQKFRDEFQKLLRLLIDKDLDFWVIGIDRMNASMPPYIQASQESFGWNTEVSSENFTNPPLNSRQIESLIALNFSEPDHADHLNYWRNEADTSVLIEKYTEVFFEIFDFDGKESLYGTTPDTSLANYIQRYYSREFNFLKFVEEQ